MGACCWGALTSGILGRQVGSVTGDVDEDEYEDEEAIATERRRCCYQEVGVLQRRTMSTSRELDSAKYSGQLLNLSSPQTLRLGHVGLDHWWPGILIPLHPPKPGWPTNAVQYDRVGGSSDGPILTIVGSTRGRAAHWAGYTYPGVPGYTDGSKSTVKGASRVACTMSSLATPPNHQLTVRGRGLPGSTTATRHSASDHAASIVEGDGGLHYTTTQYTSAPGL